MCPYRHNDKCNRGCRGFQCLHRDETRTGTPVNSAPLNTEWPCRSDGRCQYAIDHGAEGIGHCPRGKCVMPDGPNTPINGERSESAA